MTLAFLGCFPRERFRTIGIVMVRFAVRSCCSCRVGGRVVDGFIMLVITLEFAPKFIQMFDRFVHGSSLL